MKTRDGRRRCRRCEAVPAQWTDLTPAARLIVSLLELGDDIDVPATPADVDLLCAYLPHLPHTSATLAHRRQRARLYVAALERAHA